jgi:plasmid segregation protein ParM
VIIGIDIGNANTNTSEGIIFPSKISKDERIIKLRGDNDSNLLKYKDKTCLIGEGEYQTEPNKLDKELYQMCVMAALARSCEEDEDFQAVISTPASQYTEKNIWRIKNEILKDMAYEFRLAGKERMVFIRDLEVYNEAAAPYYGMTKEQRNEVATKDLIIVNIGGGNTNIAYFKTANGKRQLSKSTTIMSGMINLDADIINAVNGEFATNKALEDADDILKNGLELYGEKQDLSFLKNIILEHTDKIFKELNLYPIKTSRVMFTGGGSKKLHAVLKQRQPGCIFQSNYLMATAQGLKKVGEKLWLNG